MHYVVQQVNTTMLAARFTRMKVVGTQIDVALWQCTLVYFSLFFLELFIQNFSSSQHNYFCKVSIMYRIIVKVGGKHIISAMQDGCTITYIQHRKIYVQEVTTWYNEISNW